MMMMKHMHRKDTVAVTSGLCIQSKSTYCSSFIELDFLLVEKELSEIKITILL